MREKVQSCGSGSESGKTTYVGEFPPAEAGDLHLPSGADPAPQHDDVETSSGDCGACFHAAAGRSDISGGCGLPARILIGCIRIYQVAVAPYLPDCCRFTPSCSHYGVEALQVHGFWKGSLLTVWRVLRCQPFCRGGYDPVPPVKKSGSNVKNCRDWVHKKGDEK
jgi:putative membrane protein insertion efficiency factor